jgi:hypothetical protein
MALRWDGRSRIGCVSDSGRAASVEGRMVGERHAECSNKVLYFLYMYVCVVTLESLPRPTVPTASSHTQRVLPSGRRHPPPLECCPRQRRSRSAKTSLMIALWVNPPRDQYFNGIHTHNITSIRWLDCGRATSHQMRRPTVAPGRCTHRDNHNHTHWQIASTRLSTRNRVRPF